MTKTIKITASISDGMSRDAGGSIDITADSLDEAIDEAEEWVCSGDYTSDDSDTVDVSLVISQDGQVIDRRTVTAWATRR
jgi:hypothetical protein